MNWGGSSAEAPHDNSSAESWRLHFSSPSVPDDVVVDACHSEHVSERVNHIRASSLNAAGPLDAPFCIGELISALRGCREGVVSNDGLPYEVFKVDFGWWQVALLDFFEQVR